MSARRPSTTCRVTGVDQSRLPFALLYARIPLSPGSRFPTVDDVGPVFTDDRARCSCSRPALGRVAQLQHTVGSPRRQGRRCSLSGDATFASRCSFGVEDDPVTAAPHAVQPVRHRVVLPRFFRAELVEEVRDRLAPRRPKPSPWITDHVASGLSTAQQLGTVATASTKNNATIVNIIRGFILASTSSGWLTARAPR